MKQFRQTGRFLLLAITLCLMVVPVAVADIYWEAVQVVDGPGRKPRKKIIRSYYTPTSSRMDIGENVMIADFRTMTGYVLNTEDKMYLEMNMNNVGKIPEGLKEDIQAVPTGETKRIAGYNCRRYKVTFMNRTYDQWLSKEVKGYRQLKEINDRLNTLVHQNPLFQMGIVGRMHKLDGFPVQTVIKMGGGLTKVVTLRKVEEKPINPAVFRVPEGYKPPY